MSVRVAVCAALAAATILAYASVLGHEFTVYDDQVYVTENASVKAGLTAGSVAWAFAIPDRADAVAQRAANWHPITWLSHMLDVELFGLDAGMHHLSSVLLHAASAVLLLLVLDRMTGCFFKSAFVAAFFALHPLHVESVAWVAERKDVLSGLFWILTMGAYALWVERPTRARYAAALAFFALGLMSKPMLVTLPFALLLLDWWPLGRLRLGRTLFPTGRIESPKTGTTRAGGEESGSTGSSAYADPGDRSSQRKQKAISRGIEEERARKPLGGLILEKVPFFALAALSSVVTFIVQRSAGAVGTTIKYPIDRRIGNALVAYVRYLVKTIWPVDLAAFYPYPRSLGAGIVGGAAVLLAAITVAAVLLARRHPYLAIGWFWYLGTLVPVIGLVQVGMQSMADRYSYIPLIGIFLAAVWGTGEMRRRLGLPAAAPAAVGLVALAALSFATFRQVAVWKNTITLFDHALAVTTDNPVALNVLANFLAKQGRIDEALPRFEEASRILPDFETSAHWGLALAMKGRFDEAIDRFRDSLRLKPDQPDVRVRLAEVLHRQGRAAEAIAEYAVAVKARPEDVRLRTNYAAALADSGRTDEGIAQYEEAIRIAPGYAEAHNNLGVALASKGRSLDAIVEYKTAIRLAPSFGDARFNLASALLAAGRREEAIAAFRELLKIAPAYPGAQAMLDRLDSQGSRTIPKPE